MSRSWRRLWRSRIPCAAAWLAVASATVASSSAPAFGSVMTEKLFPLPARLDPHDAEPSRLDLRRVGFGQRGTQLWLTVRTQGEWAAGAIDADGICVTLRRNEMLGRMCVGRDARGRAVLRYSRASDGVLGRARIVQAVVERRDGRSLSARLYPRTLRLPYAGVRWFVASRSVGEGCDGRCEDRVPDIGAYTARIGALGGPRCFGAAARARRRSCVDPDLRRAVIPGPDAAEITPDLPCRRVPKTRYSAIEPCDFGDLVDGRKPAVALIGDSHSAHWRAALDVAAKAAGWRAVSLTSPGCSFSTEVYPAPPPIPTRCHRHSLEALTWLRRHPTVKSIVTSSSAGRGLSVGGYLAIWRRVPASVRRIYVIRDVPRVSYKTADCVRGVRRRGRSSVGVCSVARRGAFSADASAQAAALAGGRVRLLDFTPFCCDGSRCYPVIGGAYVYRDFNHMNPVFNTTLGPYLLRALGGAPRDRPSR